MSVPATMRAMEQTSLGGPQGMRLTADAPVPVPGRGEALIRVVVAGVIFGDVSRSRGTFLGGPQPPYRRDGDGVLRAGSRGAGPDGERRGLRGLLPR